MIYWWYTEDILKVIGSKTSTATFVDKSTLPIAFPSPFYTETNKIIEKKTKF